MGTSRVTGELMPERADPPPLITRELGNRVARARREAGLTLSTLATLSRLSTAYVSQIESGVANPTVSVLGKLAAALGVEAGELLGAATPGQPSPDFEPRFGIFPQSALAENEQGIWDLSAIGSSRTIARLVRGGAGDHATQVRHPGEEFLLVLAGSCRVSVGGEVHELGGYDSCHFNATRLHKITDPSPDLLALVVVSAE